MKNLELYVTDWEPNGTNDLLVVDGNTGEVIECIESATFGIDVCKAKPMERSMLYGYSNYVGEYPDAENQEELEFPENVVCLRIDIDTLKQKLCISPIDPEGNDLIARLVKVGIVLE